MKKTVFMPVFIAIFALAGAVLRGLNLMHGYEAATKLPVPGDKAEMALIAVCGLAALALVILAALLILLFLLPLVLGQTGVWWSVVLSQVLTACLALALKTVEDKKISVSP